MKKIKRETDYLVADKRYGIEQTIKDGESFGFKFLLCLKDKWSARYEVKRNIFLYVAAGQVMVDLIGTKDGTVYSVVLEKGCSINIDQEYQFVSLEKSSVLIEITEKEL